MPDVEEVQKEQRSAGERLNGAGENRQNATRMFQPRCNYGWNGEIPDIFANSIDLLDIFAILRIAKPVASDGWRGSHSGRSKHCATSPRRNFIIST